MSAIPLSAEKSPALLGYYGKVPVKGDFVGQGLPRAFLDPWDGWLQEALGRSREQLGDGWLASYLVSPIWHFALPAGLCGEWAVAGVLMPSVDRVGRYYPLMVAALLPEPVPPARLAAGAEVWYAQAETLARSSLEESFDLADFDALVARMDPPGAAPAEAGDAAMAGPAAADGGWRMALSSTGGLAAAYAGIVDRQLASSYPRYSLWWSSGSDQVQPSFLVVGGMPRADGFSALLDGRWEKWNWASDGDGGGTAAAPLPWA